MVNEGATEGATEVNAAPGDCLNCGTPLVGTYCHHCAQRADTGRMDWHWLSHEVQHGIFHVDRGILFTMKQLCLRPGHAVREYLDGKRKRYFPPFTLVMVLAAVSVVILSMLPIDYGKFVVQAANGLPIMSAEDFKWLVSHQSLLYLGMLPFMAFGSWFWLRKYGYNLVEHVVINTYIAGLVCMISMLSWAVVLLPVSANAASLVAYLLMTYASIITMVQIHRERPRWKVVLRTLLAFASSMLVMVLLSMVCFIGWAVISGKSLAPPPPVHGTTGGAAHP